MPRGPQHARRSAAALIVVASLVLGCQVGGSSPGPTSSPSGPSPAATVGPRLPLSAEEVGPLLTVDGLRAHLVALDRIARDAGGSRAVGTPGFEASDAYVERTLAGYGYRVEREPVEVPVWRDLGGSELRLEGVDVPFRAGIDVRPFEYSPPGSVEGELVVLDACSADPFRRFPSGGIAYVRQNASCEIAPDDAEAAGAVAFVRGLWHGLADNPVHSVPPGFVSIPLLMTSDETATVLEHAEGSLVAVRVNTEVAPATTFNLLAELPGRDPGRVVLVGAHLDSAAATPGIDDNGTGVAAVIEIARVLAGRAQPTTIRFAWWTSEEIGLRGSRAYVEGLSDDERSSIVAYVNADTLGAVNPIRGVYTGGDDAAAEARLAELLGEPFAAHGLPVVEAGVLASTDAVVFAQAGVTSGGLIAGWRDPMSDEDARTFGGEAGELMDPCGHLPCDDLGNVDPDVTLELSRALAAAVVALGS